MDTPNAPTAVDIARRLSGSERLRQRRFELLPLRGPGAAWTDVQGRGPGETTTPAGLADLISSIGTYGVLQPILVEEVLASGARGPRRSLVAGERRLRAARWGATSELDNPHFQSIPAVVCPGPLSEEERRTWQLVENLAREDLRPGELAAALLFERCALLTSKLLAAGTAVPVDIVAIDDPVGRFQALERLRGTDVQAAAPWQQVLRRLGIQLSPRKARAVVAAFAALPPELSAEMDEHRVALHTRLAYVRLDRGRRAAAAELWEAVKAQGRPDLLGAAVRERLEAPEINAEQALDRAAVLHADANTARAERLRAQHATEPVDGGERAVAPAAVAAALAGLRALVAELRSGHGLRRYDAGSLRLIADELLQLLDATTYEPTRGAA
jgi:ParB family chromosome partitioning protein